MGVIRQGGHKDRKLREFEKFSKSWGKLREIKICVGKIWETNGSKFVCLKLLRKNFKLPWKSQGKLR